MNDWKIGINSWIIQDGNYPDFHIGDKVEFALEFFPDKIVKSESKEKYAHYISDSLYEINGKVIYCSSKVWVIDFGIAAFQEIKPPKNLKIGDYVNGKIFLGIDPFYYFEYLFNRNKMPELIYTWCINKIQMQTAPFIEITDKTGQKVRVRDKSKFDYRTIKETNSWDDDNGNADYVLICTKFNINPKFKSATAIYP